MKIFERLNFKKILLLGSFVLILFAIAVTVYLSQQQQEIRTRATARSTTLSLIPADQTVIQGNEVRLDVYLEPGTNQVNFAEFSIKFDANKASPVNNGFALEAGSTLNFISQPSISSGTIHLVLSTGYNPENLITASKKLGTLNLKINNTAELGESQVYFDSVQVRSAGQNDSFKENVFSSANPAILRIVNPTPSPTPSPTLSPTPTPSPSPTPFPTPTTRPTPTPSPIPSPTPTPTISPTPTPIPETRLNLAVGLDGIGITSRIPSGGNKDPKNKTRTIDVKIFRASDNLAAWSVPQAFTYNSVSKKFDTSVTLPSDFQTGIYNVYLLGDRYLTLRYPGSVTITKGQTNSLSSSNSDLVTGDINKTEQSKNLLNILDYNVLVSCSVFSTGNARSVCNQNPDYLQNSDLDDDGIVNQDDITLLVKEMGNQSGDILPQ